ncbi:hypothetical protein, partial [Klebsiella pneumoniae]|uniref:hypothetical protein n=2 Tax=Klebsiella pneumoniae TaxID=573 RepID=UPI003EB6F67B
ASSLTLQQCHIDYVGQWMPSQILKGIYMSTKRTLSDAELFASLEAEQLPELEPELDLEQLLLELDFDLKPLLLELGLDC